MIRSLPRALVLYANYASWTKQLSYYDDWLEAFHSSSLFSAQGADICQPERTPSLEVEIREADVIVLLHSTNADSLTQLKVIAPLLSDRRGALVAFVGNELSLPGNHLSAKRDLLATFEPDFISTQLRLESGKEIWGDMARKGVLALPHALNIRVFRNQRSLADRSIDVGARATRYTAIIGDTDRNELLDFFKTSARLQHLKRDISSSRLNRQGWADFLNNCVTTVSSEAGTWYLEKDDQTVRTLENWVAENYPASRKIAGDNAFLRLARQLPSRPQRILRAALAHGPIKTPNLVYEQIGMEEIINLLPIERPCNDGKCISSRHFDAIGTETAQVLLEGRYNDILTPGEHFIELKHDYSNIDDVIAQMGDRAHIQQMTRRTLEYALSEHLYAHRLSDLHDALANADLV